MEVRQNRLVRVTESAPVRTGAPSAASGAKGADSTSALLNLTRTGCVTTAPKSKRRERRNQMINDIVEAVSAVVFAVLVTILFWLFLYATPDQSSGEADMFRQQIMDREAGHGQD